MNLQTGDNFDESVYRKWWTNYNEGYNDAIVQGVGAKDLIDEMKETEIKSLKAKFQYQDQRREFTKLIRNEARNDYNKELIIKCVEELQKQKPLIWTEPKFEDITYRESILLLSDWHYGLFTSNYWNFFDKEEFLRRIKKLVEKTIEYSLDMKSDVLHVFLLGDLIHGLIHTTARIVSMENVVEQTMYVCEILAEILTEFANKFKYVAVHHVIGNHERVSPAKEDSINKENFSLFIPWYLESRLQKVENVYLINSNIDEEIVVTNICGKNIIASHGHREGNNLQNIAKELGFMCKVIPDYVFVAHTHHTEENETHGCDIIVNPCLSGVDDHSKEIRKTNCPAQKLLIFNKGEGRIATFNIKLN